MKTKYAHIRDGIERRIWEKLPLILSSDFEHYIHDKVGEGASTVGGTVPVVIAYIKDEITDRLTRVIQ